jgi:hypothetical protein
VANTVQQPPKTKNVCMNQPPLTIQCKGDLSCKRFLIEEAKNRVHPCANLPCNVDSGTVAKKFAGLQVEIKKPKFERLQHSTESFL